MTWILSSPVGSRVVMSGITAVVTVLAVLLHYHGLQGLSSGLQRLPGRTRPRVVLLILALLVLHAGEIALFGIAYCLSLSTGGLGRILSLHPEIVVSGLFDYLYFSAVVYTTVGFGDIVPRGPVRLLVASEAVTGLVLITWSASFTFLEMQRNWRDRYPGW